MPTKDGQPDILSISTDAFGRTVVVDTQGTTVLEPQATPRAGSTFAVNVSWGGGKAEIRWSSEDDSGNNRSLVHVGLYGAKTDGYTTWGTSSFLMRANGDGWSGWSVSVTGSWTHMAQRDVWVGHDAAGYAALELGVLQGEILNTSCNNIWGTQVHGLANYVVLPYAPFDIRVRAGTVATTSFGVEFTRSSYDHVDADEVQWALDPGFGQVVWTDNPGGGGNGSQGYSNPAGAGKQLTPGTLHYVRARSHTGRGWGGYSPTVSQTTLPAVPPGLSVSSSPSGSQATLTFTPPGGVTGVSPYRYEGYVGGVLTYWGDTPNTTVTVNGTTPGVGIAWRASAFIGSYQSPWSDYVVLVQAKPNTNPGDYFDGNSTDLTDLDYQWTGTPNASTSVAMASGVDGWSVSHDQGAAVLYRVTAGLFSPYAARVQITADVLSLHAGQVNGDPYRTEVTADATYVGSIHVRPGRGQSLAAVVLWYNAAGGFISSMEGAPTSVPGGVWMRLAVGGVAPDGAAWAVVRVKDRADGAGWSQWLGGETLDLDGAMISLNEVFPYFDGNTLSDGQYVYEWDDVPNASVSTRTPIGVAAQGAFMPELGGLFLPSWRAIIDPDCTPVPPPPRPPVIPSDCIEDVGVWRRYYTQIPSNLVPDWMDVVPTLDIITGSSAARQVRIRYYPNPDDLVPEQIDTSTWMAEQIVSFMPAHTILTLDGVTQRVWAEVNGSEPVGADHLLYGTNGRPATWPLLSCGISYLVSVEVPINEPQGNVSVEAALTARA